MLRFLAKVDPHRNLSDYDWMRVLLLVHPEMRPDASLGTERDVWRALKALGHQVEVLPLRPSLKALDTALAQFKPDVVFNLLEEMQDEGVFDFHPVSHLEALGIAYTGCNPRGLIVSRNKLWVTEIARGAGVLVPASALVKANRAPAGVPFPAFIKFSREHASLGITNANRVATKARAEKEIRRLRARMPGEIIMQEFIRGEDISVAVFGNARARALAPWTIKLGNGNAFATERIKFDALARRRRGIRAFRYRGPAGARAVRDSLLLFRVLDLSGYARFDFRVREKRPYLVDVNANPNLARTEDFASSARSEGIGYEEMIRILLRLARTYHPRT